MELRLELRGEQKLVMTPQLQQAISLLKLNRLELQQKLSQELLENVFLEEVESDIEEGEGSTEGKEEITVEGESEEGVEPSEFSEPLSSEECDDRYDSDWRDGGAIGAKHSMDEDFPSYEETQSKPISLKDDLLFQLQLSSKNDEEQHLGSILIGNIDEAGFLTTPLEEIAKDENAPLCQLENALDLIQTIAPPGVGARDLQECFSIQLKHFHYDLVEDHHFVNGAGTYSLVKMIVANHLTDLQKKRYQSIAKEVGVTIDEVYKAVRIIGKLNPKPGLSYCSDFDDPKAKKEAWQSIIPDVIVSKGVNGEWIVKLNQDGLPHLQINPHYKNMIAANGGKFVATKDKESLDSSYNLEEKFRGAQWLISSIEQRNKTILKVVHSLINFQEAFLERGIQYLKPLVLRQVAEDIDMAESTISRVTTNKYMDCPQGIKELKFFFNASIQRSEPGAENLSSLTVQEFIKEMVTQESPSKPLKDQEIVARLKNRGIDIARRTVAKYRAALNIAPASQRKHIPS